MRAKKKATLYDKPRLHQLRLESNYGNRLWRVLNSKSRKWNVSHGFWRPAFRITRSVLDLDLVYQPNSQGNHVQVALERPDPERWPTLFLPTWRILRLSQIQSGTETTLPGLWIPPFIADALAEYRGQGQGNSLPTQMELSPSTPTGSKRRHFGCSHRQLPIRIELEHSFIVSMCVCHK